MNLDYNTLKPADQMTDKDFSELSGAVMRSGRRIKNSLNFSARISMTCQIK